MSTNPAAAAAMPEVRSHETVIEIRRPVEEVWKALTDPEAIARWFAPKVTVEPGVGGSVAADWGPGILWKTHIELWEPNAHLRLTETRDHLFTPPGIEQKFESRKLVQDYYLEGRGGTTMLRLVHSGFGTTAGWDEEYEGTRGGWAGCFLRMKHSLEEHRNESVHNRILTRVCAGLDRAEAFRRLDLAAPSDLRREMQRDNHICGVIPSLNGSVFNASVSKVDAGSVAYLELLMYGVTDVQADAETAKWTSKLEQLFPAAA